MSELNDAPATASQYYASLVGAMEYRLADLYTTIANARAALEVGNVAGAKWHLTWASDRIEDTAQHIVDTPVPANMEKDTYLRDVIYGNRK